MTTYLVKCECGKNVPVQIGQAGEQVICACGAKVAVPTLRQLRHLPTAEPEVVPTRAASWDARKGVVAAGLIAAAVLAGIAAWSRFSEPAVPTFPTPTEHATTVSKALDSLTPVDGFQMWVEGYRPLAVSGFTEFKHPHADAVESYIAGKRFLQKVLLALAALSAVIALAAVFWPGSTRRV